MAHDEVQLDAQIHSRGFTITMYKSSWGLAVDLDQAQPNGGSPALLVGGGRVYPNGVGEVRHQAGERRDQPAAPRLAMRPDSSRPYDTGPRCDSCTIGKVGAGKRHRIPLSLLLRSALTVRTAASARPGPGAKAARSRSDSPPQTPYRSLYWIA
jgi:hypothetical protein